MRYMPIVFVVVLISALRITGHKEQWFQAVAHLYVGALLGRYFTDRSHYWVSMLAAVILSIVELGCFLILPR